MCGINGILLKKNSAIIEDRINQMNSLLVHRGPDFSGVFHDGSLGLGHQRLSILDLTDKGNQPFTYSDFTLTFNGEIYNFLEIRDELISYGYSFNTKTDTEVLLKSYIHWGSHCVEKFNGMWAFAIYDKKRNKLFCSRDRFGIKPFYYFKTKNEFIFSSEIKPLLIHKKSWSPNLELIHDFIEYGLVDHKTETFFSGISRLEAGTNLEVSLDEFLFSKERYYSIDSLKEFKTNLNTNSVDQIEKSLYNSIKLRLRSDVEIGSCLSGGLDSSTIAVISKLQSNNFNYLIHGKSYEGSYDESYYANMVAKSIKNKLKITKPSKNEFQNSIINVLKTQEEPFGTPSILMQNFVFKKTQKDNIKVLLDGQGADEVLMGYETFYPYYFAYLIKRFKFYRLITSVFKLNFFKTSLLKAILNAIKITFKLDFNRVLKSNKKSIFKFRISNKTHLNFSAFGLSDFRKKAITSLILPSLLRYEDKNSMSYSIETRLPFLDYQFIEKIFQLKPEEFFKNGHTKYPIRFIMEKRIDPIVCWRKNKFGFEAPKEPFDNEFKLNMIDYLNKSKKINSIIHIDRIKELGSSHIWKVYIIGLWLELFNLEVENLINEKSSHSSQ